MAGSAQRIRNYNGPIFFSHGFRPFFLYAGIWASFSMFIWVFYLLNGWDIPTRMAGVDWHMHEMVFGYSSAVIAGFLLTAIPNWTGRLPIMGWPTAFLSGLWVLGRVALFFSLYLPQWGAPIVDISFLFVLAWVIGNEIISGKNWRNIKVLVLVVALATTNLLFHMEAIFSVAYQGYAVRLGVGLIIFLISIIGGRIIPSFTRNWLKRQGIEKLPVPFNSFDKATLVLSFISLLLWIGLPGIWSTKALAFAVGLLHLVRLWRWKGWRAYKEPMVVILHIAYVFIPIGFLSIGAGDIIPGWRGDGGIPHAFMAGTIGTLTLGMMTRVSLGHTGRPVRSNWKILSIYWLIVSAAVLRISAELDPGNPLILQLSAVAWILAFAGFSIVYFPIFLRPRA